MRRLFNIIPLLLLFVGPSVVLAQAPTLAGFVYVNAIGIRDRSDITASGRKLTRSGLIPGMATSGLGIPVGSYQIQVTAPGCETATAPLQIAVGSCPILVAYLERVLDPKTNTTKNFIRLLQLPSEAQEKKYLITAISVDPTSSFNATAGSQTQPLQFKKPVVFDSKAITVADPAGSSDAKHADEKGSYYCIAFHQADGKVATVLVPQRIYSWEWRVHPMNWCGRIGSYMLSQSSALFSTKLTLLGESIYTL